MMKYLVEDKDTLKLVPAKPRNLDKVKQKEELEKKGRREYRNYQWRSECSNCFSIG